MTRKNILLLSLVMVLGVVAGFFFVKSKRADYVNFPPQSTGPWIAFGDSLTEGYGASEGANYPALLSRRLGVNIVNFGTSSHTTADGLKRIEEVAQLNPRVVLLCLGGNDVLERVPPAQTFRNLAAIMDRLHQQGAFVVLIGVRSASLRDRNAKLFKKLGREKRVLYVPNILRGIFAKPVYMYDPIHPNDEGYKLITDRLEKILRPLLPKLRPPLPPSDPAARAVEQIPSC